MLCSRTSQFLPLPPPSLSVLLQSESERHRQLPLLLQVDSATKSRSPCLCQRELPLAAGAQVVTETDNHIDTKVNQFVVFGTFGLSDHVDVSIAIR
jgi:hypothetical protein